MAASHLAGAQEDSSLSRYIADFIVNTRSGDVPEDVAHLGKRSVLDGIGLALAGAASQTGAIVRRYLESQGIVGAGTSTVIGADMSLPARFAAFANGVSIHADDYDDTQLAVLKDRVYGCSRIPPRRRSRRCLPWPSAIAAAAAT